MIVNKVTMATTVNTWSLASLLAPIHYQRVPTHINCVDTRPLYRQDTLPRKLVKKNKKNMKTTNATRSKRLLNLILKS